MSRPSWNEYFFEIAKVVAKRSTCLRVPEGIGAVLVKGSQILSTGYAGSIKGLKHCTEVGCDIDERTGGCVRTVHAEINAILQAAQHGVNILDSTLYTTMSPCWDCFKALVNGGVKKILYWTEYRTIARQRQTAEDLSITFVHCSDSFYVPVKS